MKEARKAGSGAVVALAPGVTAREDSGSVPPTYRRKVGSTRGGEGGAEGSIFSLACPSPGSTIRMLIATFSPLPKDRMAAPPQSARVERAGCRRIMWSPPRHQQRGPAIHEQSTNLIETAAGSSIRKIRICAPAEYAPIGNVDTDPGVHREDGRPKRKKASRGTLERTDSATIRVYSRFGPLPHLTGQFPSGILLGDKWRAADRAYPACQRRPPKHLAAPGSSCGF